MASSNHTSHWLRQYGNKEEYRWRQRRLSKRNAFCRPLGLVEFSFDADGRYYEGRADMNCLLQVEIRTKLSKVDLRERILIAFARLRCQHLLLRARTFQDDTNDFAPLGLHFAVDVYNSVGEAIENAGKHLVFLEDHYAEGVDYKDFYLHCQNVARVFDPEENLSRVFVLPVTTDDGRQMLRFQFIIGHEICDGLSSYVWMNSFVRFLNDTEQDLRTGIARSLKPEMMEQRLPLPQEALYSPIPGSLARQRWFWAITRILRHVRKPLPVGFDNPLQRKQHRKAAVPFSPVYGAVLDYSKTPVLNNFPSYIHISAKSTARLQRLCKEAKASVGAGIYALCALTMMEFEEQRLPDVPLTDRKAFITGFPLNPRAFFNHHNDPESMMLAFSDGISLPFLPSCLDLEGRIRLLARQAQRQLAVYQKRARPTGEAAKMQNLNSRGAGLVLANQYLFSLERVNSVMPEDRRTGESAQGQYPASKNPTMQTCGVSSVGNREAFVKAGTYDLNDTTKDMVADFRDMTASVRARDGEFLLGIGGSSRGLFCTPSVDANRIDPELAERWRHRFETILDETDDGTKAKL